MLLNDDGCLCCCLPGLFGVEESVKNNESDSSISVRAILGGLDDRQNTFHKQFLEVVCAKCFGYCHIADLKLKLFTLSFEAKNGRNSRDGYLRIFDMDLRQITAETRGHLTLETVQSVGVSNGTIFPCGSIQHFTGTV